MSATGRYAILIRHSGLIDQYARSEPRAPYPADNINAWPTDNANEAGTYAREDVARAKAAEFAERFGSQRYRFSVIQERLVPRWYLVDPENYGREKRPVGSVEQL